MPQEDTGIDERRIGRLQNILDDLIIQSGRREDTKIYPNATVINSSPADLPAGYIIIQNEEGFYIPAVKVAGLVVSNGDQVNVLYVKGTEPIAYQHGSQSGFLSPKNNFIATSDPTVNDDSTLGYSVGSLWVNITGDKAFILVDSTATAAIWDQIDGTGGGSAANLLSHSLVHDIYQENSSVTGILNDTYFADVWNIVHGIDNIPATPPDIARATNTNGYHVEITTKVPNSLVGMLYFFEENDTLPLRGQELSCALDAWGTNVSNLRAALLSWTSTADSITSNVVSTWAFPNPTLATNWAYVNTPSSSVAITGTKTRYTMFENVTVPNAANNLALFIWTPDQETTNDVLNIGSVQLEIGSAASDFRPRLHTEELILVKRYYQRYTASGSNDPSGAVGGVNSANFVGGFQLPVTMRVAPTVGTSGTFAHYSVYDGSDHTPTDFASWVITTDFVGLQWAASGLTAGNDGMILYKNSSAYLEMDSRL